MRWSKWVGAVVAGLAVMASAAFAQGNPTGRLSGRVTSSEGALPGVTVTATSANLQGQRVVQSNANGDYLFAALPPGDYAVVFELSGFDTQTVNVRVPALQDTKQDMNLSLAAVTETITVTGEGSTISQATTAGASYDAELIEELPIGRGFAAQALLAPGVADTGPNGALTISGSMSFENQFTVNGVVVNENIRGQAFNLFIPDAVQEVSTQTAAISAEYGRFGGGVVNLLTKSGGNDFSGSLGSTLNNQDWVSEPPVADPREDKITPTYEATFGGRIIRDRLWFFTAGLGLDVEQGRQTFLTNQPYDFTDDTRRYEGKLTAALSPNHTLMGTGIKEERDITNFGPFGGIQLETAALDAERGQPQELWSANYTGIFSQSFYGELQYSEREFTFVDSGGDDPDLIRGTPITDSANSYATYHAPYFCGAPCLDEERSNENLVAKASMFLSTGSLGTHDIVAGYDTFNDIRVSENHQSPTDFVLQSPHFIRDGQVYGQLIPFASYVVWWPILTATQGTEFKTNSFFLNDRWQLNDRLSFNLGVRYDKNDGKNSEGAVISDDENISPRLGMSWDLAGDGKWVVNASYGKYVTALANSVADSSSAGGVPATLAWLYGGPELNTDPNGPLLNNTQLVAAFFDWFNSIGGVDDTDYLFFARIPGLSQVIADEGLKSPNVEEYTLGLTKQFGSRASLRMDYIHRDFNDFYITQRDRTTGIVTDEFGQRFDLAVVRNARGDELERVYDAVQTQFNVRLNERLTVGGNYTWSHARGNFNGENTTSGPITGTTTSYPEYNAFAQNNPRGDLAIDQRHKARVWMNWQLLQGERHRLSFSLLQNYFSGTPYGAAGAVVIRPYVTNPGYATPPQTSLYFFTNRDEFRTDDITATDLSLNYSFSIKAGGRDLELFVQPEVLNVLDEDGAFVVNTSVRTANNSTSLQPFNPFTETPIEGVHYELGPNFGRATREADFQTPRTFRLRLGVRF
jgi:outer membrane receptor protein involved in Fe transport